MPATPSTAPETPAYNGRLRSGTSSVSRENNPWVLPATPAPLTARPRMNICEDTAVAHMVDPQRNVTIEAKKIGLVGYSL